MNKIVSKKGKTFAQVAKPIQNLIEKLKDRPKSQANDNTIMLLEKQLDDLFAKQEAIKEAENPQPEMPMEQPMQGMQQMQQPMDQPMAKQMPMPSEEEYMGQPEMAYGGYLPKYANGIRKPVVRNPIMLNSRITPFPLPVSNRSLLDPIPAPSPTEIKGATQYGTNWTSGISQGPINQNYIPASNNVSPIVIAENQVNTDQYVTPQTRNLPEAKVASVNYYNPTITGTNSQSKPKNKFDRWGEVGAIGTSIGALTKEMRNINNLKRPGMLQNIYLTPGAAPDKVDYTAEQERLNTDVAAAREANRLAGGNPAVLGQLRAEQLRRRGEIMQGQENANTTLMNQFKKDQAEAFQKSQAANADIAKENMYNIYGYDQNQVAQRNAAIASGANTIGGVFNNMTKYQNEIDAAKIMANANPKSVWTDSAGQKYLTLTNGENVPIKAFGGMIKSKKQSKVNLDKFKEVIKKR
jgi:hypothetical protein